ncbi:MAG: 4Fe-4S binding protein [Planctomycetia bacterium]|jgi:polyferredoxin/tetratricopeptide (TPR) repeat protein|nr:4Fe-4S binding protein [Planctomycetia bacterium]
MAKNGDVSLTVMASDVSAGPGDGRPRKSRMEGRRFLVLLIIQALMIVHVVQWLVVGTTLAPIEPSESIQTVRDGVITVGFVFFVLAIGSTMIFGRFFCGWGCHVILLQDFCGRLLARVGLRPKPFRSRLLLWMPLGLALYLFVWPVAHRFLIAPWTGGAPPWPGWSWEVVTQDYWATFPGLLMGIPFLLVCGFLTVYLLGMKGYCTYACPYGGFFAPAEQVAPMRIRVNDDCEHCGHCTAVCTSNVRVHEEVERFGMVVDPGCMKCLDCVSVCPNDALSVGMGRPAISVDAEERAAKPATTRYDMTWPEEIVFAGIALGLLLSIRGAYSLPLLFASGTAACGTWIVWKAWRVLRDRNASLHRTPLKRDGRLRPAGGGLVIFAGLLLGFSGWLGTANIAAAVAFRYDDRVLIPPSIVFSEGYVVPESDMMSDAETSLAWYDRAAFIGDGGWSPIPAYREMISVRKAWLLSAIGRFDDAAAELDDTVERLGMTEDLAMGRSRLLRVQNPRLVDDWYGEVLDEHPSWMRLRDERVMWRYEQLSTESAIEEARAGVAAMPDELLPLRRLAVLLVDHGGPEEWRESAEITERTLLMEPDNPNALRALALARAKSGDFERAEVAMRAAVELVPTDWKLRHQFALLLYERGSIMAAEAELAESLRLWEAAGGEEAGPRPSLPAPVAGPTRPTGS